MSPPGPITRAVRGPDELRVLPSSRAPELGPRILFFSGGTALRPLCRVLKQHTHNSIHLVTPFDSGGSSAQLRQAFAMPAVGDLRNRIVALADESLRGNPQVYRLFSHRLPSGSPAALRSELDALVSGDNPLVGDIVEPMRRIVQSHLGFFVEHMPSRLDLGGANIGNLLLTAGYLSHSRDLDSVLFSFSKLLEVRGVVRPIVDADLHLRARLADESEVVGQHRLTGKAVAPIRAPVRTLSLVRSLADPTPASVAISDEVRQSIENADLICYPMGSFYSSVLANLLPQGVGRAIVLAGCARVYVPNTGADSEQLGMSVADGVEVLLARVRADAGADVPLARVVNVVLLDRDRQNYSMHIDSERLERMGVQLLEIELVTDSSRPYIDPERLTETLLSLA